MKTSSSIPTFDIAQTTGLSQKEIHRRMSAMNVEHDGSEVKAYPRVQAMKLVNRHRQNNKSLTRKRYGKNKHQADTPVTQMVNHTPALTQESDGHGCRHDIMVSPQARTDTNITVNFRVGPTNSGKTYNALERLFAAYESNPFGRYVYAGPLRMLAFEVYEKMVARFGAENVGFLTGDSQVNPEAPLVACTVEMTPSEGNLIILDEAHWCIQNSRGHKWTHLMTQGRFNEFEIICSAEAVGIIKPLFADSTNVYIHAYERRTPMVFGGEICINDIPSNTAVVCFSRKKVFEVARHLKENGYSVGVLYGALPLVTRKDQVARFLSGEYNVMVVTDVIGHGVNLPLDNVVFAETVKFDGSSRRKLMTWEGGQIAGRAGRFGYSDQGTVYLATGLPTFSRDRELVERFVQVAAGELTSDLPIIKPAVAPPREDLRLSHHTPECLPGLLDSWFEKAAESFLATDFTPIIPLDVRRGIKTLPYGGEATRNVMSDCEQLWQLLTLPLRPEGKVLKGLHHLLAIGDVSQLQSLIENTVHTALGTMGLTEIENAVLTANELEMARLAFPEEAGFLAQYHLGSIVDRLSTKMSKELRKSLR